MGLPSEEKGVVHIAKARGVGNLRTRLEPYLSSGRMFFVKTKSRLFKPNLVYISKSLPFEEWEDCDYVGVINTDEAYNNVPCKTISRADGIFARFQNGADWFLGLSETFCSGKVKSIVLTESQRDTNMYRFLETLYGQKCAVFIFRGNPFMIEPADFRVSIEIPFQKKQFPMIINYVADDETVAEVMEKDQKKHKRLLP